MTTEQEVRASFWRSHPRLQTEWRYWKRQNDYRADIRMAFVGHVDHLQRSGDIDEELAAVVTL